MDTAGIADCMKISGKSKIGIAFLILGLAAGISRAMETGLHGWEWAAFLVGLAVWVVIARSVLEHIRNENRTPN